MIKEYIKIPTYLVLSGGIQSCLNIIGNLHILEENNYLQLPFCVFVNRWRY